jgi:outer membrane usher protein
LAPTAFAQSAETEPLVVELRVPANGAAIEALAWRSGDDIFVMPDTLRALGLNFHEAPPDRPVALTAVPGASVQFVEAEQAIVITCTAACFQRQVLDQAQGEQSPLTPGEGAFLNIDMVASRIADADSLAGAFELGLFQHSGFGGVSWTAGAGGDAQIVRLDTSWTIDMTSARARLRLGDSIAYGGSAGVPFHFGGIQYGTDFSIDPTFISFATPTFQGEAATPSVVDLYINGALRAREHVDAGPFEIANAPVVAGAGIAQVVITDALGREQAIGAPFYASPNLLRPGLAEYAIAIGAERENYARLSSDYGRAFALGAYRRGLADWATAESRIEIGADFVNLAGALTLAHTQFGQIDVAVSGSDADAGDGGLARLAWSRYGDNLLMSAEIEAATQDFQRLGQRDAAARTQARATLGLQLGDIGTAAITGTVSDIRLQGRIETLNFSYSPPPLPFGSLAFSALYVDDGEPFSSFGLTFVRALGSRQSVAIAAETSGGANSVMARIQSAAPLGGGLGWRAGVSQGAVERYDFSLDAIAQNFEARFEAGRAVGADGLRGQFSTSVVWIDRTLTLTRPVRTSFAMVHVGAPDVAVYRDRTQIGRTDADGQLLITGLRPYETNRIGIDIDDLPLSAQLSTDEISVRTRARSGVVIQFPVRLGEAGEVRIVDETGAPLAAGAILVRDIDSARFPIGRGGQAYISDVVENATLTASGPHPCHVVMNRAVLASREPLRCVR